MLVDGARLEGLLQAARRRIASPSPASRIPLRSKPRPKTFRCTWSIEDADLAVIDKPAGMMVHAGSGQNEDARSRGTLVNALLHRFQALSSTERRIAPRHRASARQGHQRPDHRRQERSRPCGAGARCFPARQIKKTYIALVHGAVERPKGTITAAIGRDPVRRTRMTTRAQENAPLGRLSLRSCPPPRDALRQIHPGAGAHRDRPHPPDSRAHGFDRTSGGGRHALRSRRASSPTRPRCRPLPRKPPAAKPSPRGCAWAATFFTRPNSNSPTRSPASRCRSKSPLPRTLEAFLNGWRARRLTPYRGLKRPRKSQVSQASESYAPRRAEVRLIK